jgi:hypothetical protein
MLTNRLERRVKMKLYRQGDLIVIEVDSPALGEEKSSIIAEGEHSGHRHRLERGGFYEAEDPAEVLAEVREKLPELEVGEEELLGVAKVLDRIGELVHEVPEGEKGHGTIPLQGEFAIFTQREFDGVREVRVTD